MRRNVQPFKHLELEQLPRYALTVHCVFGWGELTLTRLPVPNLHDTCRRYKEALAPLLVSGEEKDRLDQQVEEFLTSGAGDELQQELLQLAKETQTSWLEGFWDACAYLEPRCPIPINVNPGFLFRDDGSSSQIKRATWMVHASVLYYASLIDNTLRVDEAGTKRAQLCTTQFGRFFATCRIPLPGRDEIRTFEQSRHIVVLCRNQFFSVTVLEEKSLTPLPQATLTRSLQEIKRLASDYEALDPQLSWKYPVGVLTTMDRDKWAATREDLIAHHPGNAESVSAIDSAIMLLCLDDDEPQSLKESCDLLLHNGDGTNRWFDKTCLVVCANGKAGVTMEHSAIDGSTMLSYLDFMFRYAQERAHEQIPKGYYTPSALKPLLFRLDTKLRETVFQARVDFSAFASTLTTQVLEEREVGEQMLRRHKVAPDAFVQVAFQAAYYRLRGAPQPASTYESCQTKIFFHGRTEVIRSVTPQSHAFATHLLNVKVSHNDSAALLRAALAAHRDRTRLAAQGQGVDRHLLGLKQLALMRQKKFAGYMLPRLLTDPLYSRLSTSVLSTSNCGSKAVSVFCFGPVTPAGLGLGYVLHKDGMQIAVSSFEGEATAFADHLRRVIHEMHQILEQNPQPKL